MTWRDGVIEELADSEAGLIALAFDMTQHAAKAETYRLIAVAAVGHVRELHLQVERLEVARDRLVDECRALRAVVVGQ